MSARDVAELVARTQNGDRVEFLFFWGHDPEPDGRVGRGCLSQWAPTPFAVDGVSFATAEHYMMWHKAKLFDDERSADQVLRAASPREAKDLGRAVRGFDGPRWNAARSEIVTAGNVAKFAQHPALRDYLLGTGEQVLVEASPLDRVWGIGLHASDPRAQDPAQWRGLNLLGFALTTTRAILSEPDSR